MRADERIDHQFYLKEPKSEERPSPVDCAIESLAKEMKRCSEKGGGVMQGAASTVLLRLMIASECTCLRLRAHGKAAGKRLCNLVGRMQSYKR